MSDLIRREDVIKLVNQFVFGLCKKQNDEVRKTFIKYIEKMPTAYDIDKVVEELEEIINPKEMHFCRVAKGICIHDEDDIECIDCVAERAIEIVKQGGLVDR